MPGISVRSMPKTRFNSDFSTPSGERGLLVLSFSPVSLGGWKSCSRWRISPGAIVNQFLVAAIGRQRLPQRKQMLGAVIGLSMAAKRKEGPFWRVKRGQWFGYAMASGGSHKSDHVGRLGLLRTFLRVLLCLFSQPGAIRFAFNLENGGALD